MKIVLASKSPRRKEMLIEAGYDIEVDVSNFDELSVKESDIKELVKAIAKGKATTVADRHKEEDAIIVAADTLVYFEGKEIGQQHNDEDAKTCIQKLLGKTHQVLSGICIMNLTTGNMLQDVEESKVTLKNVPEKTLIAYIKSGQYKGKAGAYNIADPEFDSFVESIEGSYSNIMGFPIDKIKQMIEEIKE